MLERFDGVRGLTGKDLAAAADAVRGRALTIATGLIALVAVCYTAHNAGTARQGHITDRYTKAIEQLGSDKLDIRLGGIYALERIARDSARDHPTVMEVLTAFVREHSREAERDEAGKANPRVLRTDLQAALTVIGRRVVGQDSPGVRIDLSGADLAGATLAGAHLTRAHIIGSDLTHTNLTRLDLTDGYLIGSDLTDTDLTYANLTRVHLTGAYLTDATLTNADLTRATLISAHLTGANLTGADLLATNLTRADLTDVDRFPRGAGG
ncbi:pentapeptide repeat-containing protein [Streptosporangium sp. KLBMP 9127]|nr:pentapeptide repeat-containing protein [Streptosporangium sp. KLBMP 9127]